MRTRATLTAAAILAVVLPLAACSGEPLPEPDPNAPSAKPADSADSNDSADAEDSDESAESPEVELADGEYALEGTLKKLDYREMLSDEVAENIGEDIPDYTFYAIEFDEPIRVTGRVGPGYSEREPSYAIVSEVGKRTDSDPNWESYLGKRLRIISHTDEITIPNDLGMPPSSVLAHSKHAVEVLD